MGIESTVIPQKIDVNSFPDNVTLEVSAGHIQIKDGGVNQNKLAPWIWALILTGL